MTRQASEGEQTHLSGPDAVAQMRSLAKGETGMLCTFVGDRLDARPMGTQGIDDDGTFWFFSAKDSEKNQQIAANARVQLIYAKGSSAEYMSLEGVAAVVHDRQKIDELWTRLATAWFTDGKTDPRLTLIRVTPVRGHYWDTKQHKVVALLKIAVGAALGKAVDVGVQGDLRV